MFLSEYFWFCLCSLKEKSSYTFNAVKMNIVLFLVVQQFTNQTRNIKLAFLSHSFFRFLYTYSFYNYLLLCVRNGAKVTEMQRGKILPLPPPPVKGANSGVSETDKQTGNDTMA